jgi:hypothetical protein
MILAAITVITWIAVVCGASFVILLLIVLAPWPRVRDESRRLDSDVETRLMLHEDPASLAEELDETDEPDAPPPVAKLRPDERR